MFVHPPVEPKLMLFMMVDVIITVQARYFWLGRGRYLIASNVNVLKNYTRQTSTAIDNI